MKWNDKVIVAGIAIVVILAIIAVIGAACCACLFCAYSGWHAGEWSSYSTVTEHRTDTTVHAGAANIELYVDTINGDVTVQESAAASNVTVTFDVFYPQGHSSDMQTSTRSELVGNDTVRITADAKRGAELLTGNYGAHVTVVVPKGSSYVLHLSTLNGAVSVAPLHGSSAYLNSMNGDVAISGGSFDNLRMETYNGDVEALGGYESANSTLITRNGRIEADTLQTTGTLSADNWNGGIQASLPAGAQFTLDASTLSGHVSYGSLQLNTTVDKSNAVRGYTAGGAGSLTVTLTTRNGDIEIGQ